MYNLIKVCKNLLIYSLMKKSDLVTKIASELDTTKTNAEKFLGVLFDTLTDVMKKGDSIMIPGFGTFTSVKRDARTARNPMTGKEVKVPAKNVPKFKPSSKLKDELN